MQHPNRFGSVCCNFFIGSGAVALLHLMFWGRNVVVLVIHFENCARPLQCLSRPILAPGRCDQRQGRFFDRSLAQMPVSEL